MNSEQREVRDNDTFKPDNFIGPWSWEGAKPQVSPPTEPGPDHTPYCNHGHTELTPMATTVADVHNQASDYQERVQLNSSHNHQCREDRLGSYPCTSSPAGSLSTPQPDVNKLGSSVTAASHMRTNTGRDHLCCLRDWWNFILPWRTQHN